MQAFQKKSYWLFACCFFGSCVALLRLLLPTQPMAIVLGGSAALLAACVLLRFDDTVLKTATPDRVLAAGLIVFGLGYRYYEMMFLDTIRANHLAGEALERARLFLLIKTSGFGVLALFVMAFALCMILEKLPVRKALRNLWNRLIGQNLRIVQNELSGFSHLGRWFAVLAVIYLVAISTIILGHVDYLDDMRRKFEGDPAWLFFSRYLSDFICKIINTSDYVVDLAPLTQLVAVAFMAAASLILLTAFSSSKKITFWNVIAVLPLGISPYFLECFSYKFDSPHMAMSVLSSVFPLLFTKCHPLFYACMICLGAIGGCTTYQAALGIFPVAVAFLLFMRWQRKESAKSLLSFLLSSVGGYLAGILIFRTCIMTVRYSSYATTEMFPLAQLLPGVLSNLSTYFGWILSDFDWKWLLFLGIIMFSFVLLSSFASKRSKLLTLVLAILVVACTLCLSYGPYMLLQITMFEGRAMYGFGAFMAIIALICTQFPSSHLPKLACVCLSWCLLSFSFLYGNALREQQKYVDFRMETALYDLHQLENLPHDQPFNLQLSGNVGKSPIIERMPQHNGVLERLVQSTFADSWDWDSYHLYHYYDLNANRVFDLNKDELPLLFDGYYNAIYGDGENFVLEIKRY